VTQDVCLRHKQFNRTWNSIQRSLKVMRRCGDSSSTIH